MSDTNGCQRTIAVYRNTLFERQLNTSFLGEIFENNYSWIPASPALLFPILKSYYILKNCHPSPTRSTKQLKTDLFQAISFILQTSNPLDLTQLVTKFNFLSEHYEYQHELVIYTVMAVAIA